MLTKRIIPCLDIKDGRVVKGVNFVNLKDSGSAIELAQRYYEEGADELVFLDITATEEKRKTLVQLVKNISENLRIPFTVGGGINNLQDIEDLLKSGADKVSLNSAIVKNPELIEQAANRFGSQAIVAAIDYKKIDTEYCVYIKGGKEKTNLSALIWCKEVQERGAGEILLTSMDKDGTKSGFDLGFINKLNLFNKIPLIASGGAGEKKHFLEAFTLANADACLAASLFHNSELKIIELKKFLSENGVHVRI